MTTRRAVMRLAVVLLVVLAAVVLRYPEPGPPAVRTVALEDWPSAVAVDAQTAHAFIASSDVVHHSGRVSVLDTTTGALVRTIHVGLYPKAMAVDARTGRVCGPTLPSVGARCLARDYDVARVCRRAGIGCAAGADASCGGGHSRTG